MTHPDSGEFLGTMILVLLGDGVVAAVLLKRSKAEGRRLEAIQLVAFVVRRAFLQHCVRKQPMRI